MGIAADQAAAIAAVLSTVPNAGLTYDYQPVPSGLDFAAFVAKFVTDVGDGLGERVRAWTVAYQGERTERRTIAIGSTKVVHRVSWLVRFYLGWNDKDKSEATFRDLVEAACKALNSSVTLKGASIDHTTVDATTPNNGQGIVLGDIVCHYAELRFDAMVEETLATQ